MIEHLEDELFDIYRSFSPERIQMFVNQHYKAKIKDAMEGNTEKNHDELQEKILLVFMDLHPLICLFEYIVVLEEYMIEQSPLFEDVRIRFPQGSLDKVDSPRIIIIRGEDVSKYKLVEFIKKAREDGPTLEVFIKGLEDLMEDK